MSKTFDPYHRWLGISPKDQPPNHYRLLGIDLFEDDPEVIQDAAHRQTAHVRTYQLGRHSELSQKILNEIAAAKACLLDPQRKLTYDQQLRAKKQTEDAALDEWLKAELPETPTQFRTLPPRRPKVNQQAVILGAIGAGLALVLVLLAVVLAIRTPKGTIVVRVDQADAEISVDDGQVTVQSPGDSQPVRIQIAEGEHTLKVSKGGFETHTEKIVISPRGQETIGVELVPIEREALARTAPQEPRALPDLLERTPEPGSEAPSARSEPDRQEPIIIEEGFVSLFDGKTLNGWQGDTEGYAVDGGKLVCEPKGHPALFTTEEYTDFILRFDFKLESGSNNGLAIRSPLGASALGAMEIQILDDSAEQHATLAPEQYHGSIFRVAPAERGKLNPVGEWNSQEVVCQGRRVQVTLNGTTILDVDLDGLDAAAVERCPGINRASGHLGFLGHRSRAEFRNIRIKKLEPAPRRPEPEPEFVDLFDGKTLTGWDGDPTVWRVEDGAIVGSPRRRKLAKNSFLSTQKTYRDFVLEAKCRIRSGNSGIQFRSRRLAGYQLGGFQAEIAAQRQHMHVAIYDEARSRAVICETDPAQVARYFNQGGWNQYTITCRGSHVQVMLNGYVTADHVDRDGLMLPEGVIGLQVYARSPEMWVAFKDIRIKELNR